MRYLPHTKKYIEWRKANTPKVCPVMGVPLIDPCVDHNHKTGMIRGVLSRAGNVLIGKAENVFKCYGKSSPLTLPQALRNAASYLESQDLDVLHPKGCRQLVGRFRSKKQQEQVSYLAGLGLGHGIELSALGKKELVKIYESHLKSNPI